jgi:hypothetical protein
MLELRPTSEYCDKRLPLDTMICSFESAFCATCAQSL